MHACLFKYKPARFCHTLAMAHFHGGLWSCRGTLGLDQLLGGGSCKAAATECVVHKPPSGGGHSKDWLFAELAVW